MAGGPIPDFKVLVNGVANENAAGDAAQVFINRACALALTKPDGWGRKILEVNDPRLKAWAS
jgi:hypothetical protein